MCYHFEVDWSWQNRGGVAPHFGHIHRHVVHVHIGHLTIIHMRMEHLPWKARYFLMLMSFSVT
jgi:hypothetical protein